jgi:pyruvate formate lyase activating enzyme
MSPPGNDLSEALLYERAADLSVRCSLCCHRCRIEEGKRGICGVRETRGGKLFTLVKNRLCAFNIDPVEKKPLYHFLPGTVSLSIATAGCNFRCGFCQNYGLSQAAPDELDGEFVPSDKIVEAAVKSGSKSISYTYTEPVIFFETAMETGLLAREKGLRNIFVTNGYLTKEAAALAKNFLDAANVDLKFFDDAKYKRHCGAGLDGVLEGIDHLLDIGVWVEITTLVIPELNDSEEELRQIAKFIAARSKDIPWHISRFHPDFKMTDSQATPMESLKLAERAGKEEGLNFIYTGNLPGKEENTFCPKCGKILVERLGFSVAANRLADGCCSFCGFSIAGCFA